MSRKFARNLLRSWCSWKLTIRQGLGFWSPKLLCQIHSVTKSKMSTCSKESPISASRSSKLSYNPTCSNLPDLCFSTLLPSDYLLYCGKGATVAGSEARCYWPVAWHAWTTVRSCWNSGFHPACCPVTFSSCSSIWTGQLDRGLRCPSACLTEKRGWNWGTLCQWTSLTWMCLARFETWPVVWCSVERHW